MTRSGRAPEDLSAFRLLLTLIMKQDAAASMTECRIQLEMTLSLRILLITVSVHR